MLSTLDFICVNCPQDLDFGTVSDMVKFIYSGRLKNLADKSDLLLVAADKYDIKDLKEICCQHLAATLNTEQVRQLTIILNILELLQIRLWTFSSWLISTRPQN